MLAAGGVGPYSERNKKGQDVFVLSFLIVGGQSTGSVHSPPEEPPPEPPEPPGL